MSRTTLSVLQAAWQDRMAQEQMDPHDFGLYMTKRNAAAQVIQDAFRNRHLTSTQQTITRHQVLSQNSMCADKRPRFEAVRTAACGMPCSCTASTWLKMQRHLNAVLCG